jgi:hypothetical protein
MKKENCYGKIRNFYAQWKEAQWGIGCSERLDGASAASRILSTIAYQRDKRVREGERDRQEGEKRWRAGVADGSDSGQSIVKLRGWNYFQPPAFFA